MPSEIKKLTKRTILQKLASIYDQKLASIYDPFEIISPTTIIRKIIYCDVCDSKLSWNDELPGWVVRKWEKWEKNYQQK